MDDLLEDLNESQQRAVLHRNRPLLVLAGPGSGKTRVIVRRIAWRLLYDAIPPRRLLAITFTNRAAEELKSRLASSLDSGSGVRVGTFHWMATALLHRHIGKLGYRTDFRLLKPREARQLLKAALVREGEPADVDLPLIAAHISRLKNGAPNLDFAVQHRSLESKVTNYFDAYQEELRRSNSLDLDDLLSLAVRLLEEDSRTRETCRSAYEEILVDEYQDVNPVQHRLLELLLPSSRSFVAVGDEDQAIYGWRAADVESILRFPSTFSDAETVKLEDSYRCTKHILRAARQLISHNRHRIEKKLRSLRPAGQQPACFVAADEREESDWIAKTVATMMAHERLQWDQIAVLYRTNAQSRVIEDALLRRHVPYRIHSAKRFHERAEIRSAVAFLRLVLDPLDDEAVRLLIEQQVEIGHRQGALLLERARRSQNPFISVLRAPYLQSDLTFEIRSGFANLARDIDALVAAKASPLTHLVSLATLAALPNKDETSTADYEAAQDNLSELSTVAQEFQERKSTLRAFITSLGAAGTSEGDGRGISCMSIHSAKGLEFEVVFLAGMEEGTLPHRRAVDPDQVEEERRLCYVAMTRPREELFLSYSRSRTFAGRSYDRRPSRFLGEIGTGNLRFQLSPHLSQRAKPLPASDPAPRLKEDLLAP